MKKIIAVCTHCGAKIEHFVPDFVTFAESSEVICADCAAAKANSEDTKVERVKADE